MILGALCRVVPTVMIVVTVSSSLVCAHGALRQPTGMD